MSNYIESFGALPSKVDIRNYKAKIPATVANIELPKEFEIYTPSIKSQGSTGSCVAHALAEAVEFYHYTQEHSTDKMSTGYIYGNRHLSSWGGAGMYVSEALETLRKYGTCPYSLYPDNSEAPIAQQNFEKVCFELSADAIPNRISSYYKLEDEQTIKLALYSGNPVVFAIAWFPLKIVDGVMQFDTNGAYQGSHCMYMYGWNEKGWKIQNSWGTAWGNKGRSILPYDYPIAEAWGLTDEISETKKEEYIASLKDQIKELILSLEDEKAEIKRLGLELDLYKTAVLDYQKGKETLEAECREIKETILSITEQIKNKETELAQLKSTNPSNRRIKQLEEEIAAAKESKIELDTRLVKTQDTLNALLANIEKYEMILQSKEKEIEGYKASVERYKEEIQQKDVEIKNLNNQLLEIKKPFKWMSDFFVKIINAIANFFKKK